MPVEKQVAFVKDRGHVCVEKVAVGCKQRAFAEAKKRVIRKDREFKHHLVDFAVAVAAHADDFIFHGVEHGEYFFRGVLVGKVVARAVVKNIAKEQ